MKRSPLLLGCILFAAVPLMTANPAWSKPVAKKSAKKVAVKAKVKPAKPAVVAAASAAATPVAAIAIAQADTSSPQQAAPAPAAPAASNPYLVAPQQGTPPAAANPYLAYRQHQNITSAIDTVAPAPLQAPTAQAAGNPYLASPQHFEPVNPWKSVSQGVNMAKLALPSLPGGEFSLLPKIKTVYPTGEKPLKVLTFKCPTELVGISTPPIKLLRGGIDLLMEGLNRSDLLPFDMQQVCM